MTARRSILAISVLCALATGAFAASNASAAETAWECVPFGEGPKKYEDAHCKVKAGTVNRHTTEFSLAVAIAFVLSNTQTAGPTNAAAASKFHVALSGVETEVECTGVSGTGELTNAESGVTGTGVIEYSGCTVAKPAGKGCVVTGGAVTTKTLKGTTVGQAANKLLLSPNSGTEIATLQIEKCSIGALNNKFPVTGSVLGEASGATVLTTRTGTTTENTLKIGGNKAGLDGTLTAKSSKGNGVGLNPH